MIAPYGNNALRSIARLRAEVAEYRGKTVLVFTGPCASCTASDLKHWQRLTSVQPNMHVVIVSRDTSANIAKFIRDERFSLPILDDPKGAVAITFNAAWLPRVYEVTPNGKLTWIQTDQKMYPDTIAEILSQNNKGAGNER